jgi:2-amino-4-hydroxy-6-hydroxymethyldihydropteridine diphosphokinase
MAEVFISIGGNVGNRGRNMARAIDALGSGPVKITKCSKIYEADSWGPIPQGKYYDAVVRGETSLKPHALLAELNKIETSLGRDREREIRYGPRTVDLDILLYDQITIHDPDLEIPHPLMLERAFVLVPLVEIAPNLLVKGRSVQDALESMKEEADGVVVLPDSAFSV